MLLVKIPFIFAFQGNVPYFAECATFKAMCIIKPMLFRNYTCFPSIKNTTAALLILYTSQQTCIRPTRNLLSNIGSEICLKISEANL